MHLENDPAKNKYRMFPYLFSWQRNTRYGQLTIIIIIVTWIEWCLNPGIARVVATRGMDRRPLGGFAPPLGNGIPRGFIADPRGELISRLE